MYVLCLCIPIHVQPPQCMMQCSVIDQWSCNLALYPVLRGALFLFDIHFNQHQVENSTEEDSDSDSPTPATLPYPQPVENCCAPSVFVHGRLEYECPSLSACPLHQDVSPHTHNW